MICTVHDLTQIPGQLLSLSEHWVLLLVLGSGILSLLLYFSMPLSPV